MDMITIVAIVAIVLSVLAAIANVYLYTVARKTSAALVLLQESLQDALGYIARVDGGLSKHESTHHLSDEKVSALDRNLSISRGIIERVAKGGEISRAVSPGPADREVTVRGKEE